MNIFDLVDEVFTYRIMRHSKASNMKQEFYKLCDDVAALSDVIYGNGEKEDFETMLANIFIRLLLLAYLADIDDFEKVVYVRIAKIVEDLSYGIDF